MTRVLMIQACSTGHTAPKIGVFINKAKVCRDGGAKVTNDIGQLQECEL